jgi:uncharacterized protein
MSTHDEAIDIEVAGQHLAATLVRPAVLVPGVLFVHGWGGTQEQYLKRARQIAGLGCVCLTFDLRGHARHASQYESVSREDSLHDVIAAYDRLAAHRDVDPSAIAVVGSSYGGYLGAILTSLRPVRWLGLRAPALYRDEDWAVPKQQLDRSQLAEFRRARVDSAQNRALSACAQFDGDVLIVESEHDAVIPHQVTENYRDAFAHARSMTYRVIASADHGLSDPNAQSAYTSLLVKWMTEMMFGARADEPSADARLATPVPLEASERPE